MTQKISIMLALCVSAASLTTCGTGLQVKKNRSVS